MTTDTKQQAKSASKTVGVVALGAAVVAGITFVVLPPTPMVRPRTFQALKEGTSNWDVVYKWSYKDDIKSTQWQFFCYTTNTTKMTCDATNSKRFFTITEYFLTGFPTNLGDMSRFRWYRTNNM